MAYERVGKEALYFSNDELELLRSCVGKEIAHVSGYALFEHESKCTGSLEHFALNFTDGTMLTISNEFADMPYEPGDGEEQYVEAGNFRLSSSMPLVSETNWRHHTLTDEELSVNPTVRRVYVINKTSVHNNVPPNNTIHSLTHTAGIMLMFWDDGNQFTGPFNYMIIQQTDMIMDIIDFDISDDTENHIKVSMDEWCEPDICSTSIIRIG